ncbi:MAG TPA: ImmA/IrrE family metallo-endopeptidase [Candidatus Wunengus sp. YC60]
MGYIMSRFPGVPLIFVDKKECKENLGIPFSEEGNACCFTKEGNMYVALKELDSLLAKEPDIAHELGHFWLESHGFPRRLQVPFKTKDEKERDYYFARLHEIMEHAIIYPWLKDNYSFDLYIIGTNRLVEFLRNELPKLSNEYSIYKYPLQKVTLIIYYLKYDTESDDRGLQDRLEKAYSKSTLVEMRYIAKRVLKIIRGLSNQEPDPKCFKEKYCEVLKTIGIDKQFWPEYMQD